MDAVRDLKDLEFRLGGAGLKPLIKQDPKSSKHMPPVVMLLPTVPSYNPKPYTLNS